MKSFYLFIIITIISSRILFAQLFINEFMALNNSTIKDNFERYEDWIEIYNHGNLPIDLTGYGLTDDKSRPFKWIMPPGIEIPAKGYLLIWASNRDTVIGEFIHTNFALSGSGEFIGLSSPTQYFLDSITFGPQTADQSMGRKPDGSSNWQIFFSPTPGLSNDSLSTLPLTTPSFSHASGIYSAPFYLTITHPISNAQIFYTRDGSNPSTNSIAYTGPILIDSNLVIRAVAVLSGRPQSKIATRSFFISPPGTLPILSLVTDPQNLYNPDSGIYVNYDSLGDRWERFSTLEFISRNNSEKFSIDGGLRIHGGFTRARPKKSFRINFKREYGFPTLDYRIFKDSDVDQFDGLVIKSGANDMLQLSPRWTLLRDQLASNLWLRHKGLVSRGFYARLYLNGAPFGIYNIREHIDSLYLAKNLGIKFPELRENWTQKLGSSLSWDSLWNFIWNYPQLDSIQFKFIEDRVDVNNYIDYFAFQIYAGNFDWPHNNLFFARNAQGGKWKWLMWDVDQTFGCYPFGPYNTLEFALRDTVRTDLLYYDNSDLVSGTIFPRRLFSNQKFREKFINRFTDLLNTSFQPSNVLPVIDSLRNQILNDITFEIQRWGSSIARWNSNIDSLKLFVLGRVDSLRNYVISKFGYSGLNDVQVILSDPSKGKVYINDLEIDNTIFNGKYFTGMKITVSAQPNLGYVFSGWTDNTLPQVSTFTTLVNRNFNFTPIFVPDPSSINISADDVIINEFWLADNGTRYASIDYRPIYGDWIELLVTKEGGIDLRNWRITNNLTKTKRDTTDLSEGSIIFKNIPQLSLVPKGTLILLITKIHPSNDYYFSVDDLDYSDSTMILYVGNGNLDVKYDPGFKIRETNDRIVLLHSGKVIDYADDIGVDFVSEGGTVTPETFGISNNGVSFINQFSNLGNDDGAIFALSAIGNYNNDNGKDENTNDHLPGEGGWIVDPPKEFTGDDPQNSQMNILTPGKKNYPGLLDVSDNIIPEKFKLYQNYPNPFNPETNIKFDLPKASKVRILIYNILGQRIGELVNNEFTAGSYNIEFDSGRFNLSSGIYIIHLDTGEYKANIKTVLIK